MEALLYEDDVVRVTFPGMSWIPDARPLANVLYALFTFAPNSFGHVYDAEFPDLYPLTTLFGAFQTIIGAGLLIQLCVKKKLLPILGRYLFSYL